MTEHRATPDTLARLLPTLTPGDTLVLQPGRYTQPIALTGLHGTKDRPITLRAEPGAILTAHENPADYRLEDYRLRANQMAQERQAQGLFPSQFTMVGEARMTLEGSRHIVLDGLQFREHWPTHLLLRDSQHITVKNSQFEGGTYAIAAFGESTQGLRFDTVSWRQDARIWNGVPWASIHGAPPENPPVDVARDWRLFDGGFFTAWSIKGDVQFSKLDVRDAFNGIQMFRSGPNVETLSQHISVRDSHFERIRDNVIEPEQGGSHWRVENNRMLDVYKPFAFESGDPQCYEDFVVRGNHVRLGTPGPVGDPNRTAMLVKLPGGMEGMGPGIHFDANDFVRPAPTPPVPANPTLMR